MVCPTYQSLHDLQRKMSLRVVRKLSKIKHILSHRVKTEIQVCLTPEPWKSKATLDISRSRGLSPGNRM